MSVISFGWAAILQPCNPVNHLSAILGGALWSGWGLYALGEAGGVDRGSGGDVCLCHYQRLRNSTRVESTPPPLGCWSPYSGYLPSSYLLFFLSATIYTACAQINACKLFMPHISNNTPTKTNSAPYSWLSCASTLVTSPCLGKKSSLAATDQAHLTPGSVIPAPWCIPLHARVSPTLQLFYHPQLKFYNISASKESKIGG